jgi:putative Mg2+ transporter-C (MgtC) family protein
MRTACDREQANRRLGLRTFPLVAPATCSYVLFSLTFFDAESGEVQVRLMSGPVAGIGFRFTC